MIAFIRWISKFFLKEEKMFKQYNHEHPHFKWYLGIDAVITSLVVFLVTVLVFNTLPSHQIDLDTLQKSGVTEMSSEGIVSHITSEGHVAVYWIGPITGDTYTHNSLTRKKEIIAYLNKDLSIGDMDSDDPYLTISTYQDLATYQANLHPIDSNSLTSVDIKGGTVTFDSLSPTVETITFKGKPQIVTINYYKSQSSQVLIKNAEALRPIA